MVLFVFSAILFAFLGPTVMSWLVAKLNRHEQRQVQVREIMREILWRQLIAEHLQATQHAAMAGEESRDVNWRNEGF